MAKALGISRATFDDRFTRRVGSRASLQERVTDHGHDCILLDRESVPGRALCRVYAARPAQCRSWPFWEQNLTTRDAWNEAKARAPCPGMDAPAGRLYPVEEIRILRGDEIRSESTGP